MIIVFLNNVRVSVDIEMVETLTLAWNAIFYDISVQHFKAIKKSIECRYVLIGQVRSNRHLNTC